MTRRKQTCYTVDRLAKIIATALLRHANMQSHSDFDLPRRNVPLFADERALGSQGSGKRIVGGGEGGAEGVSHRLEDITTRIFDSRTKDYIMTREGGAHLPGLIFPVPGGAFDVRKQKCNR